MSTKRIAWVAMTLRCPRNCDYCPNKQADLAPTVVGLQEVDWESYDEIVVTGGEPQLVPETTWAFLRAVRTSRNRVFLYTAVHSDRFRDLVSLVNGVTFTVHSPLDYQGFCQAQAELATLPGSHRLRVDPDINVPLPLHPKVWSLFELRQWLPPSECKLPTGSDFFLLKD